MDIWLVTLILAAAMALLITERISVDLISMGILVALAVSGILSPREAIAGFASPAVITVGCMFMISQGMIRTGAVGFISQKVMMHSKGRPILAILLILFVVGVASAFINNTPVVVLFIPIILSISCDLNVSPSKFLIPVSYASILAGTCTLIGTSTNIIISDLSVAHGLGPLGMFELSVLGVPIAVLGIVFMVVFAPGLMPDIKNQACELRDDDHRRYLAELHVPRGSRMVGQNPVKFFSREYPAIEMLELIRYFHVYDPEREDVIAAPDDLMLVKGSASDLVEIVNTKIVELPISGGGVNTVPGKGESVVVELIIPPQSSLLGERLVSSRLTRDPDIQIMAIKRRKLHYAEPNVKDTRLKMGDILLVHLPESSLERLRGGADFIVVEDVQGEIVHRRLARRASMIFGAMVLTAATGVADILVSAMAAALLMLLGGCLHLRDAYRALEGRVLLIIVAMVALSAGMEKTGASALYAGAFLGLFGGLSPFFVLSGVIMLTSISTHILSNNATAILMLPIAISAAQSLGVDPKPFVIAVCFGASACFATPIGYQTNLLVYGPGGYRFSDYLKMGLPLNLLVLLMGSIFIPVFWPL